MNGIKCPHCEISTIEKGITTYETFRTFTCSCSNDYHRVIIFSTPLYNTLYELVIKKIHELWALPLQWQFTDHSPKHSARVFALGEKLMESLQNTPYNIKAEEMLLFVLSAYLHDAAMQRPDEEIRNNIESIESINKEQFEKMKINNDRLDELNKLYEDIRKKHAKRSPEVAIEILNDIIKGANDPLRDLVRNLFKSIGYICRFHSGNADELSKLSPTSCTISMETITEDRIKMLAGIFRFADELDLSSDRVSTRSSLQHLPVGPLASLHWLKHSLVRNISFDNQRIQIKFSCQKVKDAEEEELYKKIIHWIKLKLVSEWTFIAKEKNMICDGCNNIINPILPNDIEENYEIDEIYEVFKPFEKPGYKNIFRKILDKEINKFDKKKTDQISYQITEEFNNFLQDTVMLTGAHSQKEKVFLDDIFIYPELEKYNAVREHKEKISSEELLKNSLDYPRIVIAGEAQSGKTTLCKMLFKELHKKNFIPVYIYDKENQFEGIIENIIVRSLKKQYGVELNNVDKQRIIPIIDDFHFAKNKEKHIEDISKYSYCIVIVDDIFCLNINNEKLIRSFYYFKIKEFKSSLRYKLIKKWKLLTDKKTTDNTDINLYKEIDKTVELIDSIFRKIMGNGIMPSYPFYILSTIVTYDTFNISLNQEITSQGYCYQALIYFYLNKQGVKNDEIDIYMNFLTEIAFYIFKEKKDELSSDDLTSFMKEYLEKYNLPIKQDRLIKNLNQIIELDSFNNYSFRYPYLYYFFVAKYLTEYINDSEIKNIIENIMQTLHIDENAYIAIFMTHHSKNIQVLEEIELSALFLFDKYKSATLTKEEVSFFDEEANVIVKAALPLPHITPEKERTDRLKIQDEIEQSSKAPEDNSLGRELRRAIRTVEVMGCIIKNRAGSLPKTQLEKIFREAMNIHLRVLFSFFELIKDKETQKDLINFLSERLEKIIKEKKIESYSRKEEIARRTFWNLNFFVVYSFINKIVRSLGSDKLIEIINKVCNEINTPVSFIVKHGILMWYKKNLQAKEVISKINEKDFSMLAEIAIKFFIVEYCQLHPIKFKERQKIQEKLGLQTRKNYSSKDYKKSLGN